MSVSFLQKLHLYNRSMFQLYMWSFEALIKYLFFVFFWVGCFPAFFRLFKKILYLFRAMGTFEYQQKKAAHISTD